MDTFNPALIGIRIGVGSGFKANKSDLYGAGQEDRRRYPCCVGKTGSGKSTLLRNLIIQDIEAGRGVTLLDPFNRPRPRAP